MIVEDRPPSSVDLSEIAESVVNEHQASPAAVVAAVLWQVVGKLHLYQWDVVVYWWGGRAFVHGASPYGAIPGQPEYLHFVYPPLAAALFAPLASLNASAVGAGPGLELRKPVSFMPSGSKMLRRANTSSVSPDARRTTSPSGM